MKRAEIYIDCPVCFCLIKSENMDAHMVWMHKEGPYREGVPE
jgi:hypothetical protein